ncbi:putative nucleic acid-binding protein, contains PIN domain [Archaeoglobus sulfaticallidus PM70-1]|uniref:Putative nucleic acid-binding protein, contains PIN domain n=1 Tax=Archaeoglobus sulfaticallidus PM70-1 TaxID=387631 RepID=N0BHL2_9EURY|nr:type II toxin-antitoxin system VapC family toxin [Archaeoglobus sulfaticallidus]AGK61802.1 putative nucleic acid-binding protein, contains PIN domain [Archaeoglobus sulfaticallidus PM70-1]
MIVLDTDVLIEIFDRNSKKGEEVLKKLEGYDVATTSINLHEIACGFSRIGKLLPEEIRFLKILDFTSKDALLSAKLENKLEKVDNAVGRFDTMIAAICINRNAAIATFNKKHFERFVEFGLKLFDVG